MHRACLAGSIALLLASLAAATLLARQSSGPSLTLLSAQGRRSLPVTTVGNHDYLALDEVLAALGGSLRDDRLAGGVTVVVGDRTILLTPDQTVVSAAGRLVSLPAPILRQRDRWMVPLEFVPSALGPVSNVRYDLRRSSRLLVIGDLRVPRVSLRVETTPAATTLTIVATPETPMQVQPGVGALDVLFEADALDLTIPPVPSSPLLQAVAEVPPATVRVTTGPRFVSHRAAPAIAAGGSSTLTLELLAQTTTAESSAAPPPLAPAADPLPLPSLAPAATRTVIIDPGHGGDDAGTVAAGGLREKDVTLAVARRLRGLIESRLGLRVVLTRDDDRAVSLDGRTAVANNQKADLFISLHANAAPRPTMRGAEVYALDERGLELGLAPGATGSLPAVGGSYRSLDLIPWDTAQVRYVQRSASLAELVQNALRARVTLSPREERRLPLRVLAGANMPAVLVELGYLSHPEEAGLLGSSPHQERLAEALFDAVSRVRGDGEGTGASGAKAPSGGTAVGPGGARE